MGTTTLAILITVAFSIVGVAGDYFLKLALSPLSFHSMLGVGLCGTDSGSSVVLSSDD